MVFRPRAVTNKDGKTDYVAEAVPVEPGQRGRGFVEVIGGLRADDWVVSKGAEALENDTPLAIPPHQANKLPAAEKR